jgi:ssDNA-binding Zn-finger/Zn-ribbon topoisomerase 1
MEQIICPKCKVPMIKRKSRYGDNYWWSCPRYPKCQVICAEHPDGRIMSVSISKEVRQLRIKAHKLAKKIWGSRKKEMYRWLYQNSETGHFGLMELEEILSTVKKMIKLYEEKIGKV